LHSNEIGTESAATSSSDDGEDKASLPTTRMLAWARNSTLYRLSRRMMTERELANAIRRKAKQKFEDISEPQLEAVASAAVECGRQMGALNDRAYAETKVRTSVRGGRSKRMIGRKLQEKGVEKEIVAEALDSADDFHAAVAYARKRGFGPFRRADADEKRLTRELSSFARNGFSLDLSRRVLDMERDEAEDMLAANPL
jgi:regulatory protein